jgi:hypothetical protein
MKGVSHVDAIPLHAHFARCLPGVREWKEHDVPRLRPSFDE